MFVLREYAHLLNRLVAKNYGKAVYRGASHPRCQSLSKHTPPLRPPEMTDCVGNTPSVNLNSVNKYCLTSEIKSETYLDSSSD